MGHDDLHLLRRQIQVRALHLPRRLNAQQEMR